MEVSHMNEVFGLDLKAWNMWIEYRKQLRKPLPKASIELAQKKLAAFGHRQMEAVEYSISNGYQGLFEPKKLKQDTARADSERIEWANIRERASRANFRGPMDGEDLIGYRTLVERAESNQPRKGALSVAELLGRTG
jgi:hypothetical protein